MSTNTLSAKNIKRDWHLLDAKNKILGRFASEVAIKLMGRNKAYYVPYLDCGDYVVVTNASSIKVSGKKDRQKLYIRHSGYPGGLKVESFDRLINRRPQEIVRHAIKGMLPKTKLGRQMLKKLHVFAGNEHPFKLQLGGAING